MSTLSRHLIAEYYECSRTLLDDPERLRDELVAAAEAIGATVLGDIVRKFQPEGVSGCVVLAESHLSIHTWPTQGYVALDIFTCGGLDPRAGLLQLGRVLEARSCRCQEIVRGTPEDLRQPGTELPRDARIMADTAPVRLLCGARDR